LGPRDPDRGDHLGAKHTDDRRRRVELVAALAVDRLRRPGRQQAVVVHGGGPRVQAAAAGRTARALGTYQAGIIRGPVQIEGERGEVERLMHGDLVGVLPIVLALAKLAERPLGAPGRDRGGRTDEVPLGRGRERIPDRHPGGLDAVLLGHQESDQKPG
jgi:hypothetical protein